jgi:hypothetical protein
VSAKEQHIAQQMAQRSQMSSRFGEETGRAPAEARKKQATNCAMRNDTSLS